MRCIDPILVSYDTKGKRLFRHWSHAQKNKAFIQNTCNVFRCGSCFICRKKSALELASRCVLHASMYEQNCFLTLTYDEKMEGYHNSLKYKDVQDFKKRLRSYVSYHYDKKIDVFNVHEYGKNGKKHWHLIVFNHNFDDREKNPGSKYYNSKKLTELWPYGYHSIGDVNEASAMYQAQYMEKDFSNGNYASAKKSKSNHSGIGKPYFYKHWEQLLSLGFVPFGLRRMPLPRYFEKLAHKHFSHYYEKQNFFDTPERKALYRPFKREEPNRAMADRFLSYREMKKEKILDLETEWDSVILQYLTTEEKPEFVKAGENAFYDLSKKTLSKGF